MLKNYIKTAFRTIAKNRVYSFINILGLTIGLWAGMVVATIVIDDLSYDRQWSHTNDLYRIITVNKMGDGLYNRSVSSWAALLPELEKKYPEVETYSELALYPLRLKLNETDENGIEVQTLRADTSFWKMLDLKILAGNPRQYVEGSSNLVITESFAAKYFPKQNPVGQIIYDLPTYEEKPNAYLITGVIKDIPGNTHLRADIIRVKKRRVEELSKEQSGTFSQNYILMKPGTDMKLFTDKVNQWYKGFVTKGEAMQFEFQPIKDIYLHSDFAQYQKAKGSMQNIYIFSGVALLLLIIACVNFINLGTARAVTRLRETGVLKILGASRRKIILQFLTEAILFFALSSLLAILLYQISLPPVETYIGHPLVKTFLSSISLFALACGAIFIVSLFTGIYPAWLMSGFKPTNALKGNLVSNTANCQSWLRKSLVVLQFSISIAVLVAMIVVQQQLKYMEKTDVGFNKNNLLTIGHVSWDGKGGAFKNELLKTAGVENASISSWLPSGGAGYMSREIDHPGKPGTKINVWYISGDLDLAATMGFRINSGRLLNSKYGTDAINQDSLREHDRKKYNELSEVQPCMVTATTAKILQINKLNEPVASVKTTPVGVVQDFHTQSFKELLGPTIITAEQSPQYGGMLIRVKPGSEQQVMRALRKLWRQFYPAKLLDTNWVDDMLAKQYESESKLRQLFTFFSSLTMILAALGVFGLIVYAVNQRTKEIGIRKVLGASVASIVRLFSSDFLKLVLLAIMLSSPVAWYFMNKWLQNFAYRINISWWVFAVAGILALFIALFTISFQSIKAAIANPVKSLRTE